MRTQAGRFASVAAVTLLLLTFGGQSTDSAEVVPAFPGAEGFGGGTRGGTDGRVIDVTSLEDDPRNPRPGTLRWAVQQPGPRIVRFACAGNIRLKGPLTVTEPFLTIDGSSAPGDGVCICDHSLHVKRTNDVIVRYIRIRRGDLTTLRSIREQRLERPKGSGDLDCVSLDDSENILFDHVSLSWCNDEIFGIVRCRNVTVQWCLLAEPLSNPAIHPYGDNHAYGMNISASTISVHHCLIAHYVMRGPQFEANDVRRAQGFDPQFEAINNVLFDYQQTGSRYKTGVEDHPEEAEGTVFSYQFINNLYLADGRQPEISAVLKYGVIEPVRVYVSGNIGPNRPDETRDEWDLLFAEQTPMRHAQAAVQAHISATKLFTPAIPVTTCSAQESYETVLAEAGCSHRRDAYDERIVDNVRARRFGRIVRSQEDVGGWPELK